MPEKAPYRPSSITYGIMPLRFDLPQVENLVEREFVNFVEVQLVGRERMETVNLLACRGISFK